MRLSVVCPSRIGCRYVWLKGTPNAFGLLPSPQHIYATTKILTWQFYQINNFEVRKKTKNTLAILFLHILHMLNFKKLALVATEI